MDNRDKLRQEYRDKTGSTYNMMYEWYTEWLEQRLIELRAGGVNKNDLLPDVSNWLPFNKDNAELFDEAAKNNCRIKFDDGTVTRYQDDHPYAIATHFEQG